MIPHRATYMAAWAAALREGMTTVDAREYAELERQDAVRQESIAALASNPLRGHRSTMVPPTRASSIQPQLSTV